jgi:hypothetical protein
VVVSHQPNGQGRVHIRADVVRMLKDEVVENERQECHWLADSGH